MFETIVTVDGMMCGMCESHVNDAIRKAFPVKKVTSSHKKGETVILTEQPVDEQAVRDALADTGYDVTGRGQPPLQEEGAVWLPEGLMW